MYIKLLIKTINYLYYFNINAFLGQNFEHLPHLIHFSLSISGASKPICYNAPTGHTLIAGHL